MSARVRLRARHVQPVWAGHPWVFAQAIDKVEGAPSAGDSVDVVDAQGNVLGRGYWSPGSAIPVRILSRERDEPLEAGFLGRRLDDAAAWRKSLLGLPDARTNGYRLVHAEGDRLPGLIVDVYGDVAAVQLLTFGMKRREQDVFAEVQRVTHATAVVEIASDRTQKLEGFAAKTGVVRGPDVAALRFVERGFSHEVAIGSAQKTGFYFDQRDNRARVEELSRDKRVLDAFSYTGAFALAAARGGAAQVTALDSSAVALAEGAVAAERNGLGDRVQFVRGDAKRALGEMAGRGERFDVVVLDPPKLVPTAKHLDSGARAYRRLNALGAKLVAPGGVLVTCSCSAGMRASDFLRAVALGVRDAGREAALLELRGQAPDHPVPPAFPDGRYPEVRDAEARLMQPLRSMSRDDVGLLVGVVFDLDDTLTRNGVLEREAADALYALRDAGLHRVLVTGRPLGMAEVLARVLPLDAAVGENGAGWTWRDATGAMREGEALDAETRDRAALVLARIRERVARELPDVRLADDQRLRRRDLAFDIGEHATQSTEHVSLPPERIAALVALIEAEGARSLVSSVHAHAQVGDYDKGRGALAAITDALGAGHADASRWLFVGDSGNDAAAFARFPLSAAPSNVSAHLARLPVPPRWVSTADRGRGFAEIVAHVIAVRR